MTRRITWPQGGSTSAAVSDVDDAQPAPANGVVSGAQTPIPNLNVGVLTLLTDVIAATNAIQAKVNTLLTELRSSGVLAP